MRIIVTFLGLDDLPIEKIQEMEKQLTAQFAVLGFEKTTSSKMGSQTVIKFDKNP